MLKGNKTMRLFSYYNFKFMTYTLVIMAVTLHGCTKSGWQAKVDSELSAFGHRNWIVIADAAYPKQSAPGIETIVTGQGQLEALTVVLKKIESAPHVRAIVFLDKELEAVTEKDAPGVGAYRIQLRKLLENSKVQTLPHEQIISKLDEASQLFNILLLKTDITLPYTSVFLQLDCGYWTEEKEARLRHILDGDTVNNNP
jgi:D-ribose pyranose/furanose isomerase RbsD